MALLVAACGGSSGESTTTVESTVTEATSATTTTTVAETTVPEESSTTIATATTTVDGQCETDDPTSLSADWVVHESESGFEFSYPSEWEDVTGQAVVTAGEIVDSETLAEAGISEDEQIFYDIVRDPAGINLTVSSLEGVTTPLEVIYDRQESVTAGISAVQEILNTGLEACADGERALGLDFLFNAPRADTGVEATFYQHTWLVLHEETLHLVQILSLDEADGRLIDEALRTWQWTEPGGSEDAATDVIFLEAHMAANVDLSVAEPDPSNYTETFAADEPAIYVVYMLDGDADVELIWSHEGQEAYRSTFVSPGERWVEFHITPAPGGFTPGEWELVLEVVGGEDRVVLPFTVTP
ncbi:MAG: hypothetical protein LC739_12330 [Actinobacteria bacterium]|nr:hypothetical protein [Actinomycetota bacterium]